MERRLDTKGIDGLRGIAAIGIALFTHYYFWLPEMNYPFLNKVTYWFWNYASYFVDLFFVISGFIMVYVYKDKIKQGNIGFVDFTKKRLVRFYPMMVLALVLLLVLQLVHQKVDGMFFAYELVYDNSVMSFLLNLLCLHGTGLVGISFNAPTWYLSIVLIMYMIFYVVTYHTRKNNMENVAYVGLFLLGLTIAIKGYPTVFLNCRGLVGFFAGCILCEACYRFEMLSKKTKDIVTWLVFGALIVFCGVSAIYSHAIYGRNDIVVVVYVLLIWVPIVFLAVENSFVRNVLKVRPLRFLGKISFSMYVLHFPVMIAIDLVNVGLGFNVTYDSPKAFIVYAVAVFIAAIAGHYIVERNLNKIFKRFV